MKHKVNRRTALTGLLLASTFAIYGGIGGASPAAPAAPQVQKVELFSTPPILVRAGEQVRIPVDVVCALTDGTACDATATLSVSEASGPWSSFSGAAGPLLRFDVSAPSSRAVAGVATSGNVAYQLRAEAAGGRTAYLTETAAAPPSLRYYITENMPTLVVPPIALGDTAAATEVLYLPWGTGPSRAGLRPGNESPTLGPSSFDIAPDGTVVLLDSMQGRLAWFKGGAVTRSVNLDPAGGDIAIADDGAVYVASRNASGDWLTDVRRVGITGSVSTVATGLAGTPSQIRRSGGTVSLQLLPLGMWVPPVAARTPAAMNATTGRPLGGGGQLLISATQDRVRVGIVQAGMVTKAVELDPGQLMGALALADVDGAGGFWLVLHVTTETPEPGNQYQAVHVSADLTIERTFAMPSADYADSMTLSRFRMGPDGAIYQMQTAPDGIRIVRYGTGV